MTIQWQDLIESKGDVPARDASLKEKATLVGRVGRMMLAAGTGAWRVRASMNKISRALNILCNADIGLLSIEYTCADPDPEPDKTKLYTSTISISTTGVNTDRISAIEEFADHFSQQADKLSVQDFHQILDEIQKSTPNYSAWHLGLAAAFACGAFTFLLGGGPVEMLGAFFGAGIGNYIRKKMLERDITLLANVSVSVAAAGCIYVLLIKLAELILHISAVHEAGYICSMLFVIPGFPLITGGIDLAKLDMRSGIERLAYAVLIITMATLTGWVAALVFQFSPSEFAQYNMNPILHLVLRLMASFAGVYGFSMMFNSPGKMALTAGLIGMIANTVRLELIDFTSIPVSIAAFIGALLAGLMASAIRDKVHHFPRITLTVPSIVIMVPGLFMYKAIHYIGINDISTGALWLTKAILIVMALSLGLVFARILTDNNFRKVS